MHLGGGPAAPGRAMRAQHDPTLNIKAARCRSPRLLHHGPRGVHRHRHIDLFDVVPEEKLHIGKCEMLIRNQIICCIYSECEVYAQYLKAKEPERKSDIAEPDILTCKELEEANDVEFSGLLEFEIREPSLFLLGSIALPNSDAVWSFQE